MEFYLSTIADSAAALAREHHLGLEIADFTYAPLLDSGFSNAHMACREKMKGLERFWFHGPFAELCPAAIDPEVRSVAAKRFTQAVQVASGYGIDRLIFHGGFIPNIYYPEWFIPESVKFWREFLRTVPEEITIALENVLEPEPYILAEVAKQIGDPRLGLCLDIGHANLKQVPVETWIMEFAPFLRHVHLHSNDKRLDEHKALGTGTVDAEAVLEQLQGQAPNATITLEMMEPASSVEWLRKNGWL